MCLIPEYLTWGYPLVRQKQEIDIAGRLIAHRGYAGQYPGNTLPAIESALAAGVRHIELDLQLTADRIPVLFHDRERSRADHQSDCVVVVQPRGRAGHSRAIESYHRMGSRQF